MFCALEELSAAYTKTRQQVMDTVTIINTVFSFFDQLLDHHNVYKVCQAMSFFMASQASGKARSFKGNGVTTLNLIHCLCFQVETVGQVYMVVSGAPEVCNEHSSHMADAALAMLYGALDLRLPNSLHVRVKIGIYITHINI